MKGKIADPTLNYSIAFKSGKILGIEKSDDSGSPSNFITRKYKTHSGKYQSCSRHSEAVLLSRLPKYLLQSKEKMAKITIINIKIFKDGKMGKSCSCLDCANLLYKVGVRKSIYTNNLGHFIKDNITNILLYTKRSRGAGRYVLVKKK